MSGLLLAALFFRFFFSPRLLITYKYTLDEEQGQRTPIGGRSAAHRVNEVAMVDLAAAEGLRSGERITVGMMMGERDRNPIGGDDVVDEEGGVVKIGRGTRTGTEATLVGCDDDDDDEVEVEGKGLDD